MSLKRNIILNLNWPSITMCVKSIALRTFGTSKKLGGHVRNIFNDQDFVGLRSLRKKGNAIASNLIFAHALIAVPDLPVPELQSSWQDAEIRKPRLEIKLQN